jgi:predicted nucleic acid-binding Zn ribbon protein
MPRYLGKCDCQQCGREADAYENTAGMAYYNCGPCGVRVQQKSARGNALFMKGVRPDTEPDDGREPAAESRESREIPEPKPAAQTAQKPVKRGLMGGTIFGG